MLFAQQMIYVSPLATAIIAIIAGILILVFPRLLNVIVALYLILIGVIGLLAGLR